VKIEYIIPSGVIDRTGCQSYRASLFVKFVDHNERIANPTICRDNDVYEFSCSNDGRDGVYAVYYSCGSMSC
jgi:hypothetical protein